MSDTSWNTAPSVLDRSFGFSNTDRVRFTAQYALFKVIYLWREVETPRFRLFVYEMAYSLWKLMKRPPRSMRWLGIDKVETIFGTFNARPGTWDAACVSPAFERPDLNLFLSLLEKPLRDGRSVLFLDIGAELGTYSVAVANRLHTFGDIRVLAFEPCQSSSALLRRNLEDNDLTEIVQLRRLALGDGSESSATLRFDFSNPASSLLVAGPVEGTTTEIVTMSTIDEEVADELIFDVLAIKMDVEGMEVPVLMGAIKTLSSARNVLLMVEDFVDNRIVEYLESTGWKFMKKVTPYNSFWSLGAGSTGVELGSLDVPSRPGIESDLARSRAQVARDLSWGADHATGTDRLGGEELLVGDAL